MKIRATIATNVQLNDLVTYDQASNQWVKSNTPLGLLGAVIGIEPDTSTAIIEFSAEVTAHTSTVIASHGGRLNVVNGRVYIDDAGGAQHRFIYPQTDNLDIDGNIAAGTQVRVLI